MHDEHRQPDARTAAGHRPRWKVLGVLSAAVLLLHGALLGGLEGARPEPAPPLRAAALEVRTVTDAGEITKISSNAAAAMAVDTMAEIAVPATATAPSPEATDPGPSTAPTAPRATVLAATPASAVSALAVNAQRGTQVRPMLVALPITQRAAAAQRRPAAALETPRAELARGVPPWPAEPAAPAGLRPAEPSPLDMQAVAEPASAADPQSLEPIVPFSALPVILAAVSAPATAAPAEPTPIPRYRTEMPPAATLEYQIGRGLLRGSAELMWRPEGDRYEFRLEAFLAGITILRQVSQGGFDAAGLAPVRFTDKRVRRAEEAANFRRDRGQITFSARSTQMALRAGAQDRLSWMIQLAAIAAADPALRREGAQVVMQVVGVHADASVWVLRCNGVESLRTDLGAVEALSYARVPDGPYDTAAQIWLDPKRHYLPVRATWRSGPNDEGMDMRLREVVK